MKAILFLIFTMIFFTACNVEEGSVVKVNSESLGTTLDDGTITGETTPDDGTTTGETTPDDGTTTGETTPDDGTDPDITSASGNIPPAPPSYMFDR